MSKHQNSGSPFEFHKLEVNFEESINAITNVYLRFGYLCQKDLSGLILQMTDSLKEMINYSQRDLDDFEKIKIKALSTLVELLGYLSEQNKEYVLIVNDYYKFKKDIPSENIKE